MARVSDLILPAHAADILSYSVLIIVLTLFIPFLLNMFVVGEGQTREEDGE